MLQIITNEYCKYLLPCGFCEKYDNRYCYSFDEYVKEQKEQIELNIKLNSDNSDN